MSKTIKEYVGIDQQTHHDKYEKIVNDIGLGTCIRIIPVSYETIQKALEKDSALNTIPLKIWDAEAPRIAHYIRQLGITGITLADCVCTLKCAARMWHKDN